MKALKFKIVKDVHMKEKLGELKGKVDPKMFPEIMAIETAKVSDAIRIEFDFDLDYLMRAAKHHEINLQCDELKAFGFKIFNESKLSKQKKYMAECTPSQEVVVPMLEEVNALG